jgi:hypothetical protein
MQLTYERLKKKPHIFLRLTGTTITEFNQIVERVKPLWEEEIEQKKKQHGRTSHLKYFEDKLLALMIYYRTYITHEFVGYLVGLHNANICRLFKRLEPLVAKKITIKKDRSLTQEEVIKILADVTEQPTQRPKKKGKQKKYYSGKKKRHTLKAEIIMQDNGRILSTSHTAPGRTHDFRIRKEGKHLPGNSEKYVDSGYQGLQKRINNVNLPFKRRKNKPLTEEQKRHNKSLSSIRIRVENKIREIKTFKIMSETYRNFQKKHNLRFNIITGVVNLKHAF